METTNLFQFISVRPPKKRGPKNLLTYADLNPINGDGDDTSMLRQINDATGDTEEQVNEAKKNIANTFLASNSVITRKSSESRITGLNLLTEWFLENIDQLTLTESKSKIETLLNITLVEFTTNNFFTTFRSDLWNTIFAKIIIGNHEENDFLLDQIRVTGIIGAINNLSTDAELVEFAQQEIGIPTDVVLKSKQTVIVDEEETPFDETQAEIDLSIEKIQSIENAIEEINRAHQQKYERLRDKNESNRGINYDGEPLGDTLPDSGLRLAAPTEDSGDSEVTISSNYIISKTDFTFSDETVALLTEYELLTDKIEVIYSLESLENQAKHAAKQLFAMRIKSNTQFLIGNSLVAARNAGNPDNNNQKVIDPNILDRFVRPIGIGDLKVVRQKLVCYDAGEIAHIENVLKGENKERETRRLERSEETLSIVRESEKNEERDLQTTERHELETETSNIIKNETQTNFGVSLTASYGPVSLNTNGGYNSSNSQSQSDKHATQYAKEVVDRARQRIVEKVKTTKVATRIAEYEETNQHTIDNKDGTGHTVGIYRWLNKTYESQVYNYGKRLMFEFIVPEPAALYIHSKMENTATNVGIKPPVPLDAKDHPINKLNSHLDIKESNYDLYAAMYNVDDITPPPTRFQVVSLTFHNDPMAAEDNTVNSYTHASNEATVPAGYVAVQYNARVFMRGPEGMKTRLFVGRRDKVFAYKATGFDSNMGELDTQSLNYETEIVPISFSCWKSANVNMNIEIVCRSTARHREEWRIKTYNQIIAGYNKLKSDYDNELSRIQLRSGITINGNNPLYNRITEREELKRGCIELFTNQHFENFDAVKVDSDGYPQLDPKESKIEGQYIQFMEQSFEWDQMTYEFYPYFWGKKDKWMETVNHTDTDPLFRQFLRAGAARIIVPVRPSYNKAILYYLTTGGTIWSGGNAPLVMDPTFVPIAEELNNDDEFKSGDPWTVTLPTNLVILQKDAEGLDESGLPCEL